MSKASYVDLCVVRINNLKEIKMVNVEFGNEMTRCLNHTFDSSQELMLFSLSYDVKFYLSQKSCLYI